ncbi:uncharacterized protein T551_02917 [Pneumocystis jirovecii RU7]|uniref:Uncharacterized protein n=1 Tax=Pneumocystis jirovecii (strain RU7) TaxID=1408657 RepID=A0A0W4ZHT9_PNEJ7|nr:uncharacterized protein T551_02917 [Pneumocystis jirovecii RU7]KTW27950.1 hypothetical protein T551_02917 [Pneumocystis jirovecii RU7]
MEFEKTNLDLVLVLKEYLKNKKIILFRFPRELSLSLIDTLSFDSNEIKEIKIKDSNTIHCVYNDTILDSNVFGLLIPVNGYNTYEIYQNFYFAGQCTIIITENVSETSFMSSDVSIAKQVPESLQMRSNSGFENSFEYTGMSNLNKQCKNNSVLYKETYLQNVVSKKHVYDCESDNKMKKIKYKKK